MSGKHTKSNPGTKGEVMGGKWWSHLAGIDTGNDLLKSQSRQRLICSVHRSSHNTSYQDGHVISNKLELHSRSMTGSSATTAEDCAARVDDDRRDVEEVKGAADDVTATADNVTAADDVTASATDVTASTSAANIEVSVTSIGSEQDDGATVVIELLLLEVVV